MIKKIGLIMIALLIIGLIPSVFAETEEFIDAKTAQEIRAFNNTNGAEVRLMQLEKSITRNILTGEKVIDYLKTNNPEFDTTNAENLLDELKALLEKVKAYEIEGKDKNILVADFVAMKKQAITITQEFKTETTLTIPVEERIRIRNEATQFDGNELAQIRERIRNKINEHNAEQIQSMLQKMNKNNNELAQQIRDGNITKTQIKAQVGKIYNQLNQQEKINAWTMVKEQANKRIISEKALIEQAKNNGLEQYQELEIQRAERMQKGMNGSRKGNGK